MPVLRVDSSGHIHTQYFDIGGKGLLIWKWRSVRPGRSLKCSSNEFTVGQMRSLMVCLKTYSFNEREREKRQQRRIWERTAICSQQTPRPQGVKCEQGTSFIFLPLRNSIWSFCHKGKGWRKETVALARQIANEKKKREMFKQRT